jgi:hypothetical protein
MFFCFKNFFLLHCWKGKISKIRKSRTKKFYGTGPPAWRKYSFLVHSLAIPDEFFISSFAVNSGRHSNRTHNVGFHWLKSFSGAAPRHSAEWHLGCWQAIKCCNYDNSVVNCNYSRRAVIITVELRMNRKPQFFVMSFCPKSFCRLPFW